MLVLLEDQVSAIRLAPKVHTAALLGTNLSEAKIDELYSVHKDYETIYICLDADATWQAIKLQLKWRERIPNLQIRGLGKDVKDLTDEEFKLFCTNFD